MKRLISVGVALAMLTMVVVPVGVAAEYQEPATDSKIPFGILGSFFYLLGDHILPGLLEGLDMDEDFGWAASLMPPIGDWISGPLAWMTELMAWSMVVAGDGASVGLDIAGSIIEEQMPADMDLNLDKVPDLFYVISARIYDAWGDIGDAVTGLFPPAGVGVNNNND